MESDFYRKKKKGLDLSALLRRILRNKRLVVALILGTPILLYVLFGSRGVVQRLRLQMKKADLEVRLQETQAETRRLQSASRALETDRRALEKVAREKYGMAKEGETVYRVSKEKR